MDAVPPKAATDAPDDKAGAGHVVLDADGVIVAAIGPLLAGLITPSPTALRFRDLLHADSRPDWDAAWAALRAGRSPLVSLGLALLGPGHRAVQVAMAAMPAGGGVAAQVLLLERHGDDRDEHRARRTYRALRVLGTLQTELLHADADAESTFLNAVCRMIVERGGYRLAAVGYAEHDPKRRVRVVARASAVPDDDYAERAEISWGDNPLGQGPTGRAIRSGVPQVNRDFLTDARVAPWRDLARTHGYQSSIALPLRSAGSVFGALSIYAPEADAFDPEETALLVELADDLAIGLDTLRARADRKRADQMIARLAHHDPLTRLANRSRLLVLIRNALRTSAADRPLALLTVVIERFDDILAGIGVRPADQLLAQFSDRLQQVIGTRGPVSRIGGKSFAVLLDGGTEAEALHIAAAVRVAMRPPFRLAGIPIGIEVSLGAALSPQHARDAETLLLRATLAARASGTGIEPCVVYHGSALEDRRWLTVLGELRSALDSDQLTLAYQPKVRVRDGRIAGAEALLRWQHPQRGPVSPGEFMPIAEQSGLIAPLTDHVIDCVLRQHRRWLDDGFRLPVAVNVSARNLADPGFATRVLDGLGRHAIEPALLQLELTESALMDEPEHARRQLLHLRGHGVITQIDDFGTGYSSLAYLADLPVQALKIDSSFVSGMLASERLRSIVAATLSMSEALGLDSIAEGVETKAQAEALIALGCRELQGFWLSRPVSADALRDWARHFTAGDFGLPSTVGG